MFISCQECNTTFRLDESLLKPTGSKVRCSQCRHMFLAFPPAPQLAEPVARPPVTPVMPLDASPSPAPQVEEGVQELEGIDLAELDSIMGQEAPQHDGLEEDLVQKLEGADDGDELPELDEADLDLDFDAALELDSEESVEDTVLAEEGAEEDVDLDMDFTLDDGLPPIPPISQDEAGTTEEIEGALSLEEDLEAAAEDVSLSDEDLDLDLDLPGLDSGVEEEALPLGTSEASGDDLDLGDLDFDLDGESPEKEIGGEEPELSLADESDLALDESGSEIEAPTDAEETQDLDLDLDLDLGDELALEMDDASDIPAEDAEEPELSLEAETATEAAADDLDLGDLDSLLAAGDEDLEVKADESEELELELDLDDSPEEAPIAADADSLEEDLEDLEFELDTEFTDGQPTEAVSDEAVSVEAVAGDTIGEDGEIDLSDIEEMLEGDQVADVAAKPANAFEADLDLGLGDDSGEIDLTEIESAIDSADAIDTARDLEDEAEEPELELDLDLDDEQPQPAAGQTSESLELDLSLEDETPAADDDLELDLDLELESDTPSVQAEPTDEELDLSDLSELVEEPQTKTETIDSGDIELEFEIEEDAAEPVSAAVEDVNRTAESIPELPIEETLEAPFVDEKPVKPPKPVKPKKKTSKTLLVLFFLILLGGLGYGAHYAVTKLGIEIPYLSDYLKPKPQDPAGTINLSTMEINSKFIENGLSGRLFVITGKVRNGYSTNREKVRLQGKLFTKGKILVKTEYSYAGIMLDDQELATLPIAQIKQRLTAVPQVQAGSTIVKPGQNIPFMVIFSELPPPEQLDEFAIELLSSVQGR